MSYVPEHQYRCTIVRGKSLTELEDLLPMYANVVHRYAPCEKDVFFASAGSIVAKALINNSSYSTLPDAEKKTVDNHITEMGSALFGLFYVVNDEGVEYVIESDACKQLVEKSDFPLFFKNLCLNFQFPNGSMAQNIFKKHLSNGIHLKPYCFVVSLLQYAQSHPQKQKLTKQEIGYYVLNNLDVLQGLVSVDTVYDRIMLDRQNGIKREKLSGSNAWQHIKEQFNMLELANLIETDATYIWLNKYESKAINVFVSQLNDFRFENFDEFDINIPGVFDKQLKPAWRQALGHFNKELESIETTFQSTEIEIVDGQEMSSSKGATKSTVDLGDEGEALVFRIEKERVGQYKNGRFLNKVLLLGKTKGLGYDISSIEAAENLDNPEFARYIEVKATKRVTEPTFDTTWMDSINITSKEWTAAAQWGEFYNIYRVYFTKTKTIVVRIQNPYKKAKEDLIEVFPTIYQMNFGSNVIEKRYAE